MDKPIRVLAVVFSMRHAGLETRLMDIIRNINRERVIIDVFSYQLNKGVFDDEIVSLGGKVYYNPPLTPKNMFWYVRYFRDFLLSHPEYKIVHAHQDAWCSVFCKGAYLAGVPVRIAHSRTAISGHSLDYMAKNIIKIPARKYANYYFAVSEKAGRWLFGDKLVDSGKVISKLFVLRYMIIIDHIECLVEAFLQIAVSFCLQRRYMAICICMVFH